MRYFRHGQMWEGRAPFSHIGRHIEVHIGGQKTGPSSKHRAFFKAAEERYDQLLPEIQPLLDEHREDAPAEARFVLVGVELPDEPSEGDRWKLLYETEPSGWFYTVELKGWSVLGIGED
jgi:hypothetical protein